MSGSDAAWWDEVPGADGTVELRVRSVEGGVRIVVGRGGGAVDVTVPPPVAESMAAALTAAARSVVGPAAEPPSAGPGAPAAADHELGAVAPLPWRDPAPDAADADRAIERSVAHLRRLCEVLPDTAVVDALGLPTFRVATRIFAVVELVDEVPVVRFKVTGPEQQALLDDERFRADPDTGHHGWTNVRADQVEVGDELDALVLSSYRMVAPGPSIAALDAALSAGPTAVPPDG